MDSHFSKEVKELIAESRSVALDLGYDYISTVHLFLADCRLNHPHSIRNFAFTEEEDFQSFYAGQRIADPIIEAADLPLTKEAEKTIRKSFQLWSRSIYYDKAIFPYHFFLGAALVSKSLLCDMFPAEKRLFEKLESYYLEIGAIKKSNIHKSLGMRLSREFFV